MTQLNQRINSHSLSSEGINIYQNVPPPSYLQEDCFCKKNKHTNIDGYHRVEYFASQIYNYEKEFQQKQRLNPDSSWQKSFMRKQFKEVLMRNIKTVYHYLQQQQYQKHQNGSQLKYIVDIIDVAVRKDSIAVIIQYLQYNVQELIQKYLSAETIVQIVTQFVGGLQETEDLNLHDLDRHIENIMFKVIDGRIIGKHIDFQLCLRLDPSVSKQTADGNIAILGSKNYRYFYSQFGQGYMKLIERLTRDYHRLIGQKEELKKLADFQLKKFIGDLIYKIPHTQDKNIVEVLKVLQNYKRLESKESREQLIQNLKKCLLKPEGPHENSGSEVKSRDLSHIEFTKAQLQKIYKNQQYDDLFDDPEIVMHRYFIKPVMDSQLNKKIDLDVKIVNGISLIIEAIQKHMQNIKNDDFDVFQRISQHLKWQLNSQERQPQQQKQAQQSICLQSNIEYFHEQRMNSYLNSVEEPPSRNQSSRLPDTRPSERIQSMERILPFRIQHIRRDIVNLIEPQRMIEAQQSQVELGLLNLLNRSNKFDDLKEVQDIEVFKQFIASSPPQLFELTEDQANHKKFCQLYKYLLKYGYREESFQTEIDERICFNGYKIRIRQMKEKINNKFYSLREELIKKKEIINLVNSKCLSGIIESKALGKVVSSYFNSLSFVQHQGYLQELRKKQQYLLNPQQGDAFFEAIDKLLPQEKTCQIFRTFLKQHIIRICQQAQLFLQEPPQIRASPILHTRERQGFDRTILQRQSRKRPSDSENTIKYISSYHYDNSQHFNISTEQRMNANDEKLQEMLQLGFARSDFSDSGQQQDRYFGGRENDYDRSEME